MKKLLITITTILITGFIFGQSTSPELISNSGDYFDNGTNSLSWSIGECMTETYTNGNTKLTQGFQQDRYEISTLIENLTDERQINIFPNPATDKINIEFSEIHENTIIQLFDITGKELLRKDMLNITEQIDLNECSNSTLILKITEDGKLLKSIKVQKIN